MNSANSHQKLNPRMWTGVPRVAYTFSGTTLISLITWHKCHLPRKTPPPPERPPIPVVTGTLSFLLGTVLCCLPFPGLPVSLGASGYSQHRCGQSPRQSDQVGTTTVLFYRRGDWGGERARECAQARGWPGAECRIPSSGLPGTRTAAGSPPPPPGFRLSPGGAAPRRGRGILPSRLQTQARSSGGGGTQKGLGPQRGDSKAAPPFSGGVAAGAAWR